VVYGTSVLLARNHKGKIDEVRIRGGPQLQRSQSTIIEVKKEL